MVHSVFRSPFRVNVQRLPFCKRLRTSPTIFGFLAAAVLYWTICPECPRVTADRIRVFLRNHWAGDMVDFTYADNVTGYYRPVVPNVVHFVHLGNRSLTLQDSICIRAAWLIQRPITLVLHCQNCTALSLSFYWAHVKKIPGLEMRHLALPRSTSGIKTTHIRSFLAFQILRNEGGIYIGKNVYLVRNVDVYRHFEMSVTWTETGSPNTELIVAHRNARFLQAWWNAYRHRRPQMPEARPEALPRRLPIDISVNASLFHRIPVTRGVEPAADGSIDAPIAIASQKTERMLYAAECDDSWRRLTAVCLMTGSAVQLMSSRGEPPVNLVSIGSSRTNFGQMARLALTGSTALGVLRVLDITDIGVLEYAHSPCVF